MQIVHNSEVCVRWDNRDGFEERDENRKRLSRIKYVWFIHIRHENVRPKTLLKLSIHTP